MAELFTLPARATDSNGVLLPGAKLFFYATGTSTPQSTYTTAALSVAHTNPVVADSSGKFPAIYFNPNLIYRGVLKDASGATTVFDIDPINKATNGNLVADPGGIYTASMIPAGQTARAPLFILNNPGVSQLVNGYASGIYIHIGNNPTATPAAGDTVAQTITVNNLNGRTNLWGVNTVVLQDASGADGMVRAAEFEVNNVKGGFNADPFSGTAPYRKNGIEIVGHSSSLYKLTAAATVWVNDTTGTGWFDQGLVLSRVASKGIRFVRNPGGASDTGVAFATAAISDESNSNATLSVSGTHNSIFDLSGNPTYSQFILGKGNADTTVNVKNSANYNVVLTLDSGTSAAQVSGIDLSDRASAKWRLAKNSSNDFLLISDPLGTPATVLTASAGGGGSVGIGTAPSYKFDVSGSTRLNGNVGFQGTAPIAKPTVTGAKGGNAALTSLLTALASYGLITDSTT